MPRRPRTDKPPHPLRQWREHHGLTQAQVAEACGVTQGMVSHIEQYVRIPLGDTLERLRAYTGLSTDAFIRPERFMVEQPDFLRRLRPRPRPPDPPPAD
jgi:transcriptional regulator with XRE-family HTH domain